MRPPKRCAATISPRIQLGSSRCNHSWSFRINGTKAIVRNSTNTQIPSNEQRNRYAALRLFRLRAFLRKESIQGARASAKPTKENQIIEESPLQQEISQFPEKRLISPFKTWVKREQAPDRASDRELETRQR